MNQKRINKAKWLLFATLIGLVWLMLIAQKFPVNVRLGLALILSLEIITPLVLPSLIAVWLNLIMIVVGTASLLFGYIVMPTSQKLILIFAGPIEALFITGVANYLFHWSGFNVKSRAVQRYMEHYVSLVKLPGVEDATKLYQDEARSMFENPRLPLRMELRLIHVDTRQFRQFHEKYYQRILVAIADLLKRYRLPSERLFYLGNTSFLVISYSLEKSVYEIINQLEDEKLGYLLRSYGLEDKVVTQTIDRETLTKFPNFQRVQAHLNRLLETEIKVEYLKEGQ